MDEWIEKKRCFIIQPLREDINKISQTQKDHCTISLIFRIIKVILIEAESTMLIRAWVVGEWRCWLMVESFSYARSIVSGDLTRSMMTRVRNKQQQQKKW